MKVFDLELTPAICGEIAAHAERDYPVEACGVVLGAPARPELARVVPLKNVQDRYHQRDPAAFPRDGKDAFRLDELERMRMLDAAGAEGLVERVLYHSHTDAGAYFSPEDRAMAVRDGLELMPGVVHVVVSVRQGRRADAAAFRYDPSSGSFLEQRLSPELLGLAEPPGNGLPAMALRQLEGREASRPIRPYGGALCPREVSAGEVDRLRAATGARRVTVSSAAAMADLRAFALGHYSPLEGFLRAADLQAIAQRGRLQDGTPWRTPIVLQVHKPEAAGLATGDLVELCDDAGRALAALGVTEIRMERDAATLAGPVYVYPRTHELTAADLRAELLRRGARNVLAVPEGARSRVGGLDLAGFDGLLWEGDPPRDPALWALPLAAGRTSWLTAVMAQNQGATHLLASSRADLEELATEGLAIRPFPKV